MNNLIEKRNKLVKNYFIITFNIKKKESKTDGYKEVIMDEYIYYIISDVYCDLYNKFIQKGYRWKHMYELNYIIITW